MIEVDGMKTALAYLAINWDADHARQREIDLCLIYDEIDVEAISRMPTR